MIRVAICLVYLSCIVFGRQAFGQDEEIDGLKKERLELLSRYVQVLHAQSKTGLYDGSGIAPALMDMANAAVEYAPSDESVLGLLDKAIEIAAAVNEVNEDRVERGFGSEVDLVMLDAELSLKSRRMEWLLEHGFTVDDEGRLRAIDEEAKAALAGQLNELNEERRRLLDNGLAAAVENRSFEDLNKLESHVPLFLSQIELARDESLRRDLVKRLLTIAKTCETSARQRFEAGVVDQREFLHAKALRLELEIQERRLANPMLRLADDELRPLSEELLEVLESLSVANERFSQELEDESSLIDGQVLLFEHQVRMTGDRDEQLDILQMKLERISRLEELEKFRFENGISEARGYLRAKSIRLATEIELKSKTETPRD